MKIFVGLFLHLFLFACSDSSRNNNTVIISPNPTPTPVVAEKILSPAEIRQQIIKNNKVDFAKNGINMSVEGKDKNVLIIKSTTLTTPQILNQIKSNTYTFQKIGFKEIQLIDKTGNKQILVLTVRKN